MKLAIGTFLMFSVFAQFSLAQTNGSSNPAGAEAVAAALEPSTDSYTIFNATPAQEAALQAQIRQMHPDVVPLRIFFVPHWKYLATARDFHLHVPTGYGSLMFTHLPSRTVFIDSDRYMGEEWLGHWMAHELGHLARNSAREDDAEKAAREYRKRLKEARTETRIGANTSNLRTRRSENELYSKLNVERLTGPDTGTTYEVADSVGE